MTSECKFKDILLPDHLIRCFVLLQDRDEQTKLEMKHRQEEDDLYRKFSKHREEENRRIREEIQVRNNLI